ncbi:glucosamine kinase [Chelatococcus caeni]|uniref:Glucosamine kinase n=2 Tax=Chelatococcus caeni TaxID=1348468 RepID=A0A840C4J5_9HYPH|nr:glucosamine kinase [Chelatococcus caeni]
MMFVSGAADTFLLGVDGGGTQCRLRLRSGDGTLVGEASGGPSNIRFDPETVARSILAGCYAILDRAGLPRETTSLIHAGFGLAGAAQTSAREQFLASRMPFRSISLDTDAYAAWLGAFGGENGAILIVGTGSCGLSIVNGERTYVGGWGAEISDEGSGLAIGREAIRRALWAYDGRAAMTALAETLLDGFGRNPEMIIDWARSARPADFARLAPLVFDYASQRDALAVSLVEAAARDVARIAERLLGAGAPRLCLMGGVAGALQPWLPPYVTDRVVPAAADATEGAILMACQAAANA